MVEALAVIDAEGLEALSLRAVARRLGVSHQAPYKHFPSRNALLAEVVTRAYESFVGHLRAQVHGDEDDLSRLGDAYLDYARSHPLQYRLMFGTPLPEPDEHPEMMARAREAFDVLRDVLSRHPLRQADPSRDPDSDAMFVWATVHGLAGILDFEAMEGLGIDAERMNRIVFEAMQRIGVGLAGALPGDA